MPLDLVFSGLVLPSEHKGCREFESILVRNLGQDGSAKGVFANFRTEWVTGFGRERSE